MIDRVKLLNRLLTMQLISLMGAGMILWAFIASSFNRMAKEGLYYAVLNAVGGALLAITLIDPLNVGALILETVWCITGITLIVRAIRR